MATKLTQLPSFEELLRNQQKAQNFIDGKVSALKKNGWWKWWEAEYKRESQTNPKLSYPSQGLVETPYDKGYFDKSTITKLPSSLISQTQLASLYYLELFNHPDRVKHLFEISNQPFVPPKRIFHPIFFSSWLLRKALAINELALQVQGSNHSRTKRSERFLYGPFIKLGQQARAIFVGSANPDIWGSAAAISSLAQAHCLCGVPRDGFFSKIKRQKDLAQKVFEWLDHSPVLLGRSPTEQKKLLKVWRHNVMGVLEATPDKALERAAALYSVGVRTFRIYSPEPGTGPLRTLQTLRQHASQAGWEPIEIFAGQVVDVEQSQALEKAGADGLFIGIGGGGRCITGVRSGVAINWPQLVWSLRGKISIPLIIEGGASDNIAQTLAVGATGIGVTRSVGGGTIESPGGYRYFINGSKKLYKYYRGEASASMKAMGERVGPFDIIPYVEGESTRVFMEFGRGNVPTILQNVYLLFGDAILALVFQNVSSIAELQHQGGKTLLKIDPTELYLRKTH